MHSDVPQWMQLLSELFFYSFVHVVSLISHFFFYNNDAWNKLYIGYDLPFTPNFSCLPCFKFLGMSL